MDSAMGAAIVASVINSSSLNGRTNSSSSSTSSGYASGHSTGSTPATLVSTHYDTSTHTTMASVSVVTSEEQLPTATVAPVMPFYSEASLGQQQRQQCYHSYPYTNSAAQYNPVYDAYTGNSYHNLTTPSVERSLVIGSGRLSSSSSSSSHQRAEKQNKPLSEYGASGVGSQHYGTSSNSSSTVTTTTKPQATATPFFAQPSSNVNTSAATYYDTYGKYKMSSTTKLTSQTVPDYATNYKNHLQQAAAAAMLSYQQQQQHYYAAAKSQLQDVNYVAAVVKPHRQQNIGNSTYYNSGSAYYDKYMYSPSANTAAYSVMPSHIPSQHSYSPYEPSSSDPYRSSGISAPWQMKYATTSAGNCRNLPPVANSSTYLATPSATGNGRDSFCATAADKYGKYDKFSAYYGSPHHPQQYISPSQHAAISGPSAPARSLWSNTPHHTPHLATIPAVIKQRLPLSLSPSAPTHQYQQAHAHANTHHPFVPTANTTTQRTQSCCTKSFQQQSCYYPRPTQQYTQANSYQPTQQTQYGSSAAHKYSAYCGTYKSSNSNDLYVSSPFDPPPATYNYSGATTAEMTQRYGGMAATNSAFYSDLNVQPAFESYTSNTLAISQPSVLPQHHSTHHLNYQTHGTSQNSGGTAGLIEYRKPLSAAAANDCCMSSSHIPLPYIEQHVADKPSYLMYEIHGNAVAEAPTVITSPSIYSDGNSNSEKSTPTTKNLSLRDFLATWNEEEEEDITSNSDQLPFASEAAENSKYIPRNETTMMPSGPPTSAQSNRLKFQQPQLNSSEQEFQQYKNLYQALPKIHVGIAVDGSMDIEASQYINLPDIVIDIEKPNNAGITIAPTASNSGISTEATLEYHNTSCGAHELFENFDVEKELDELQIKRAKMCLEKQLNNEIRILTPEPIESLNQELVDNEPSKDAKPADVEQHHNTTTIQETECQKLYDNPDQFFKEIDLNDNSSHSSNSSTFEKEYETFINRIELDNVCDQHESQQRKDPLIVTKHSPFINDCSDSISHQSSDIKTPPDPIVHKEISMNDCTQNQDCTMFYKKKRNQIIDKNEREIKTQTFKQFKSDIKIGTKLKTKNIDVTPKQLCYDND